LPKPAFHIRIPQLGWGCEGFWRAVDGASHARLALAQALLDAGRASSPCSSGRSEASSAGLPRYPFAVILLPWEPIYRPHLVEQRGAGVDRGRAVARRGARARPPKRTGDRGRHRRLAAGPGGVARAAAPHPTVAQDRTHSSASPRAGWPRGARRALGISGKRASCCASGHVRPLFELGNPFRGPSRGTGTRAIAELGLVPSRHAARIRGSRARARLTTRSAGAAERRLPTDVNVVWGTGIGRRPTHWRATGRRGRGGGALLFDPMAPVYRAADHGGRAAGAMTRRPTVRLGKPSISCPAHRPRRSQTRNAAALAAAGAAIPTSPDAAAQRPTPWLRR